MNDLSKLAAAAICGAAISLAARSIAARAPRPAMNADTAMIATLIDVRFDDLDRRLNAIELSMQDVEDGACRRK